MVLDAHTLWRGFQSAVFYYASCTPYSARVAARKRRRQNARDRAERNALELVIPPTYRQPSPYSTNAYWAEEIRLGPNPPARKSNKKQRAARVKTKSQTAPAAPSTQNAKEIPMAERGRTLAPNSLELATVDGGMGALKPAESGQADTERWKVNQREDEDLWGAAVYPGSTLSKLPARPAKAANTSSESFPGLSDIDNSKASKDKFRPHGNPPVNELHPPVVSNPAFSTGSNMWMLQPPPPAAIMKGYESPSNSRSRSTTASSGSRSSRMGGSSAGASSMLGRKLSQRLVEEKLRRGEMLYPNDLRRVPSSWSNNADALRIEAKYFEDSTSSKKHQDRDSNQSTETIVRSQDKGQVLLGQASGSFEKADSGMEMKQRPVSKENVENTTVRQDFAFPNELDQQNNPVITYPFAAATATAASPNGPIDSVAPPGKPNLDLQKKIQEQLPPQPKKPANQPKRLPLPHMISATPSASARYGGDGNTPRTPNQQDSPGSSIDLDGDADDEDDDEDTKMSNDLRPGHADKSKTRSVSKCENKHAGPGPPNTVHHEWIRDRRYSVDF